MDYILNPDNKDDAAEDPELSDGVMAEIAASSYTANVLYEDNIKDIAKNIGKNLKDSFHKGNPDEKTSKEVQKMISEFRKQTSKDPNNTANMSKLKAIVTKSFDSKTTDISLTLLISEISCSDRP